MCAHRVGTAGSKQAAVGDVGDRGCICGHVAEGSALFAAGISVIVATFRSDPAKTTGLDGAVKALGQAQFGSAVLIAAAVGFAAYGLYSFALTCYSRM